MRYSSSEKLEIIGLVESVCRQRLWDRYSAGLRESFCSS